MSGSTGTYGGYFAPRVSSVHCPLSNSSSFCTTPDHLCSPRRCCGNPNKPVLGGIDLVDLYRCNELKNKNTKETNFSSSSCLPTVGSSLFVSKPTLFGGEYFFLFVNATNKRIFEANPEKYAPKAGGFCAFSLTGYDSNGAGFWCSCPQQTEGYAIVNGSFYFFLFSGAKEAFLKHGNDAIIGVDRNWPILLEENNVKDLHCFNTDRLVPVVNNSIDNKNQDKCDMMSCLKFMKCPDCKSNYLLQKTTKQTKQITTTSLEKRMSEKNGNAIDKNPSIVDYWNDPTGFKFQEISRSQFNEFGAAGMNVGFDIVIHPNTGTWFLFHREYNFKIPQPTYCKADYARVVIRKSLDEGVTWSNATVVASPTGKMCAIVDGGGYFDAKENTWHYLAQCLDLHESWGLCEFSLKNVMDPTIGSPSWVENMNNPVVKSGQLWSKICSPPSHCSPLTIEEGTPDIVKKDTDGYFWVTFHGCVPNATSSSRGVAKTKDFVKWETYGDGLPNDAIFTKNDCNNWNVSWSNGTCVGGGEGSITIGNDGYMYELIEAPDISLGCKGKGQNWVLGLLRSKTFSATGTWENFKYAKPLVVPIIKIGCYIQYHRIFYDRFRGHTYLEFWTMGGEYGTGWMHIFKLINIPKGESSELPIIADGDTPWPPK